jgi:anti-sigma-K factor RskA
VSIIINEDKNRVRRYLLGQLEEAEQDQLELRLLTDPSFIEEFDTIVDEIADQYAGDELEGEERKRVEQHFLTSAERRQKVHFARELMQRAANERGANRVVSPAPAPGFFKSVRAFWRSQSVSFRTAMVMATLVIVVGLAFVTRSVIFPTSGTDAFIALNITTADRASGSEIQSVTLAPGTPRLRIELKLPDETVRSQRYRVELLDDQQRSRELSIEQQTTQSLLVAIAANEIPPGSYIIRLYAVNPDGGEQRIRGNYFFNVL